MAAKKYAGEKLVKVYLEPIPGEPDEVFVGANDRDFIIQRGVEVEVPEIVAEVLRLSNLAGRNLRSWLAETEKK